MDKSTIVIVSLTLCVANDKLVIVVHIQTLFLKIDTLRAYQLKMTLLIGLHNLKYLEMTDVVEKYILIVSPGCYNITKSIIYLL